MTGRRWGVRLGLLVLALPLIGSALVSRARALPTCERLQHSDEAVRSPETAWGERVWQAVDQARARLDPTAGPRLVWVELGALSGAWYCRAADTIFASRALLEYAWLGRATDGADMLGFVLAHELAHRRFDDSASGWPFLDQSTCVRTRIARELEADERAAFLVALAHDPQTPGRRLSPWRLERKSTLAHYLIDVGADHCTEPRAQALNRALLGMEGFGDAFELALALAFAPVDVAPAGGTAPRSRALALLEGIDAALNPPDGWARVPELAALIAWLQVQRAASLDGRVCEAPFPRHAAATPFDALGGRAPDPDGLAAARAAAREALERARRRRLPRELIRPIERCLASFEAPRREITQPPRLDAPPLPGFDAVLELLALSFEAPCEQGSVRTTELTGLGRLEVVESPERTCFTLHGQHPTRVVVLRPADALAASLDAWRGGCVVFGQGVGDDGGTVHGARCAGVDRAAEDGWTLFARGREIERIVRVGQRAQ